MEFLVSKKTASNLEFQSAKFKGRIEELRLYNIL